jgi:beta-lactamase class A
MTARLRRTRLFSFALFAASAACGAPEDAAPEAETGSAADGDLAAPYDAVVRGTVVGLNLREAPSRTAHIIEVMHEGTALRVTGDETNGYVPVDVIAEGRSGFAYRTYLMPVVASPGTGGTDGGGGGMNGGGTLEDVVAQLGSEASARSPGTDLAIAVRDLTTGASASFRGDVKHVSASAAKVMWVAAALAAHPVADVEPYANAIFSRSDNDAAGAVIDLIGPNAINDFYQAAGMASSGFTQWSFGRSRLATNSPRAMGSDNYFTASDAVEMLARLDAGSLLAPDRTSALESWMTLSPRSGYGGWLGSLIPAEARASMMQKGGWLPPGCCSDDRVYNTLNEIGILQVPGADRYAVAIFTRRGFDFWGAEVELVEHASCAIYRAIANDPSRDCR